MDFYPSISEERGFLSSPDPLERLPSFTWFNYLDKLAYELPKLVKNGEVRETLERMPFFDLSQVSLNAHKERLILNRLRMIYAYFASAYVHGEKGKVDYLPGVIAKPLCYLSDIVRRPPILSYADYALNNWRRIDKSKDICLDNIDLIQRFNDTQDEAWFILVHVDIEANAGTLLKSMYDLTEFIETKQAYNDDFFSQNLENMSVAFNKINITLKRMPEKCSPDIYYKEVRPYIFGFENIVYGGVERCSFFSNKKEQSFRGETGAQSSLIPAILSGLGIKHKDSMLTKHLDDMRNYMPVSHRNFISHLEQSKSIRHYIQENSSPKYICGLYNKLIDQLCDFRELHFSYAIDYIKKKCDNPHGTGGTEYIKWLGDLVEETKSYHLKNV